jgi:phospholipid/cholesterol/gamma-HCH transport system ATP-binding protein
MLHNGVIIWAGPASKLNESGVAEVNQFVNGLAEGPLTSDWTNDQARS